MIKSQEFFLKSRDFDSHHRKFVTSFCPLFFILNQLSHRLEHNLAVDNLMKPSVILKFHRGNRLPYPDRKVNRKKKKITSFTISPTLLDGWRYVPYEPTTNRTWTPGTTGVLSIYTNKLGVYVLSCYLNNIHRI